MLMMIQRVFYGSLGLKSAAVTAPDLDAREHLALWPVVAVMLVMGVASPYWMRAIDEVGTRIAQQHESIESTAPPAEATTSNVHAAEGGHR